MAGGKKTKKKKQNTGIDFLVPCGTTGETPPQHDEWCV